MASIFINQRGTENEEWFEQKQIVLSKLTSSISSATALKNSLLSTGSGSTSTAIKINELFTSYGY